ncbi:MAG: hypothetical protein Q7P63_07805 [Verrucomicrobiota bacterium JB022]|nr:hypothetical protein [Verrucomicrobiota bacterium JB022]
MSESKQPLRLVLRGNVLELLLPMIERLVGSSSRHHPHPLRDEEPEIAEMFTEQYGEHTSRAVQYVLKVLREADQEVITLYDLPLALHGVIELRFRLFEHDFHRKTQPLEGMPESPEQLAYHLLIELEMKILQEME